MNVDGALTWAYARKHGFAALSVGLFLVMDIAFKTLIIPAHLQLMDPRASHGAPPVGLYLGIAGVVVGTWLLAVLSLTRGIERWRTASAAGEPSAETIRRAALSAQRFPQRMALAWSCEWVLLFSGVTYGAGTPSRLASAFFIAAMASGPLPLAHSLATWLVGPVLRDVSATARARDVAIPLAPISLRARLAFYCLAIGVAPVLYMSALALAVRGQDIPVGRLLTTVIIFLAAISLFALLCAVLLSATITGPISEMDAVMRAITRQGDVARAGRVPLYHRDEVGALADITNHMIDRLAQTESERAAAGTALAALNQTLERRVDERTTELSRRNAEMRLVLDNVEEGLFTIDGAAAMSSEHSAVLSEWFGPIVPGEPFFHYFGRHDPAFGADTDVAFGQVRDNLLPLSLTLAQMPRNLTRGGQHYRFTYAPIGDVTVDGGAARYLAVVSDQTRRVEHEILQRERNEAMAVFEHLLADRSGFVAFMDEASDILARIGGGAGRDPAELKRALHTLKGNAALFGLDSIAQRCHELESLMAEEHVVPGEAALAGLQERWGRLSRDVRRLLGDGRRIVEVRPERLAALERALRDGADRPALLSMVQELAMEPVELRLRHFAERARQIGQRYGKEIDASVSHDGLCLDAQHWSRFWQAFVHPVRNAIDHGIEAPAERRAGGKPQAGRIDLRGRREDGAVVIEIEDDGRGIQWEEIQRRVGGAPSVGPPRGPLVEALLARGVSTAREITELSGRGQGMGALNAAVRALGGDLEIDSEPGRGTRLRMRFPESSVRAAT